MEFDAYKPRENVCTVGGSYENHVIWYNRDEQAFYVDDYHYGSVDVEEFFDGTTRMDTFAVLSTMIQYNQLGSAWKFRNELHLARDLNKVLAQMEQRGYVYRYAFLEDPHYKYYRLNDDEFVIYFGSTFFSVKDNGEPKVDFSAVRRIFENYQTVTCYSYDWSRKKWIPSLLEEAKPL